MFLGFGVQVRGCECLRWHASDGHACMTLFGPGSPSVHKALLPELAWCRVLPCMAVCQQGPAAVWVHRRCGTVCTGLSVRWCCTHVWCSDSGLLELPPLRHTPTTVQRPSTRFVQRQQAIVCSHTVGRGARPRGCFPLHTDATFQGFCSLQGSPDQFRACRVLHCGPPTPVSSCCSGKWGWLKLGFWGKAEGKMVGFCHTHSACQQLVTDARRALGCGIWGPRLVWVCNRGSGLWC
jgi:hypothetical protein